MFFYDFSNTMVPIVFKYYSSSHPSSFNECRCVRVLNVSGKFHLTSGHKSLDYYQNIDQVMLSEFGVIIWMTNLEVR